METDTAAVVVTYNRLNLLQHCIDALRAQTCRPDILVIDNNSQDGTKQWLDAQPDLQVFHMEENLGGAGGFCFGMRKAVTSGYPHVWIMDDDCIPEKNALEALLKTDKHFGSVYGWLSSRCLWTDGSFCRMNIQRVTPFRDISDFSADYTPAQMASFVSLFLRSETIRKFGYPIPEFRFWTDDWEYTRRISREKLCYVVRDSVVTHAMARNTVVNIADDSSERMSRYLYFYRNDVYLYRREGIRGWLWVIAKDGWHGLQALLKGHPDRIKTIAKGFIAGLIFRPEVTGGVDTEREAA